MPTVSIIIVIAPPVPTLTLAPRRRRGWGVELSRRQPLLLSMIQFRLDQLKVAIEMTFGDVAGSPLGKRTLGRIKLCRDLIRVLHLDHGGLPLNECLVHLITDGSSCLRRGQPLVSRTSVPATGG